MLAIITPVLSYTIISFDLLEGLSQLNLKLHKYSLNEEDKISVVGRNQDELY